MKLLLKLFLLALPLFPSLLHAEEVARINIHATPATVERITFNPKSPPKDMPPLKGNEAAETQYNFGCEVKLKYEMRQNLSSDGKVDVVATIKELTVTLKLHNRIFIPQNGNAKLRAHEEGHREINERVYKDAESVAREEAQRIVSKTWIASSSTPDAAGKAATDQAVNQLCNSYMKRVAEKASRIGDIYDELTDHGRSMQVTVNEAIAKSIKRYDAEQRSVQH